MPTKETGGREAPHAKRARLLRIVIEGDGDTASAFAARMGFTANQWINVENGYPASRAVVTVLKQKIPGFSVDWLYFGSREGLSLEMAERLGELPSGRRRTTANPGRS